MVCGCGATPRRIFRSGLRQLLLRRRRWLLLLLLWLRLRLQLRQLRLLGRAALPLGAEVVVGVRIVAEHSSRGEG